MKYQRNNRRSGSVVGFNDLLFNLLISFVCLFIIAFIMMNPPTKKKSVDPKAEYLITMTWPDGDTNDIDLWAKNKHGVVSFRARDNETMHLDRDDLGMSSDSIEIDGKEIKNPMNSEAVSIRQTIKGEYTISIHWYSKKHDSLDTVPVEIEIIKINPYRLMAKRTVIMNQEGQEKTAFNFTMNKSGWARDFNTEQKRWVIEQVAKFRNDARPRPDNTRDN